MTIPLVLQVLDDEADAEELNELADDLRRAVIEADPVGIAAVPASDAAPAIRWLPDRSIDPTTLGVIVLSLVSSKLVPSVLRMVETWIAGRRCVVEIQVGTKVKTIKISGGSPAFKGEQIGRFLDQVGTDDPAAPS